MCVFSKPDYFLDTERLVTWPAGLFSLCSRRYAPRSWRCWGRIRSIIGSVRSPPWARTVSTRRSLLNRKPRQSKDSSTSIIRVINAVHQSECIVHACLLVWICLTQHLFVFIKKIFLTPSLSRRFWQRADLKDTSWHHSGEDGSHPGLRLCHAFQVGWMSWA